jgi:hypothetical protein
MTLVLTLRQRAAELVTKALALAGVHVSQPDLTAEVTEALLAEIGDDPVRIHAALKEALGALVGDVVRNRLRVGRTFDAVAGLEIAEAIDEAVAEAEADEAESAPTPKLPRLRSGWYETIADGQTIELMQLNRVQIRQAVGARLLRISGDWHRVHLLQRLAEPLTDDEQKVGDRFSVAQVANLERALVYPSLASLLGIRVGRSDQAAD